MNYDNEIDEILNSLKERKEREKAIEASSQQEDDSQPLTFSSLFQTDISSVAEKKAEEAQTEAEIITEEEKIKTAKTSEFEIKVEDDAPIEPPKPSIAIASEGENEEQEQKRLVWFDSEKELKKKVNKNKKKKTKQKTKKDKKKIDLKKIQSNVKSFFSKKEKGTDKKIVREKFKVFFLTIKTNFKNKLLPVLKKIFTKQLLLSVLIIAILIGAVFGGIKLYEYSRTAYLKPYQEKYDIDFPEGILEEFCDIYGENQYFKGELIIDDTNTKKYVANQKMVDNPYLKHECNIAMDEHFRTIDVSKSYADLESIYSSADGFLASSQKITFNTLFEKSDYRVIAAFYTNKNADDDNGYVFPYNAYGNMTEESFSQFRDRIKSRRLYNTGYLPKYEDYVLTLSTDSDFMDNFKFVVVCIKNTDKKFVKSETAEVNEKTHYPQIWYNENKKENPYKYSSHWYPEIYIDEELTQTEQLSAKDFE